MSEIVIRHAEPKDYDAIRQIHAQPEVYHNTLQVPHPSLEMWQARLTEQAGVKQLVACIDDIVVGHLSIQVTQRPRRSHVADFGICVDARWHNRGIASALIHTMIDMCDNWLRVERIELTVFVDNEPGWRCIRSTALKSKAPVRNTACATVSTLMRTLWRA
ncbi:N-acetyltransferase [Salmonella enterica subsp. enterica serovar Enteritidis]|nr:N-acetyltransferase [Salmonella enterica subsp. enterica serovar Enteritidis]ECN1445596.1 N-acetyltransferase [Salmonella enterica subsp. enterica serovar Enteritidis]ECY4868475.1 N-acetyltransferase [Salmonella enterica subsp. enterica serovar Enteritidis]HAF7311612.1 N-acetyltransferase [Salmonella enterica]HBD8509506.1 N-acetyltransferase [Salmonella enterica subsp. enterica]